MYNVFSALPLDTMLHFHAENNLASFLEGVEYFILHYLPFQEDDERNSFSSPHVLRKHLQNRIKEMKPIKVAELAIELCAPYLGFWNHFNANLFFKNDGNIQSFASLERNYFLDMAELFCKELFANNELVEELIQFLMLSHYYIHSHTFVDQPPVMEKQAWSCIINNQSPETGQTTNELYRKIDDFVDKKPYFLNAFLIRDNCYGIDNRKESNTKFHKISLRSIIDMPILTGILSSSAFSKNAFIFNRNTIKSNKLNLRLFLSMFNRLFTVNSNIPSMILKHYSSDGYSSKIAYIYDQYILERLSGINYVNYLYKLDREGILPSPICKELEVFMLSPIPKFRFRLLKSHEGDIASSLNNHPELIALWNHLLDQIVKFQVMCSLPILDFVFHYLMALKSINSKEYDKEFNEHYYTDMMNYISSLSNTEEMSFYVRDNNDDLIPNKYPFLLDKSKLDKVYAERCPLLYLNFFDSIIKIRMNNLLSFNGINALQSTITNCTISFLTNTLPSLTDNIVTG